MSHRAGMSYREIRLIVNGDVAELVLARPEARNAMIAAMGAEIQRAVAEINAVASHETTVAQRRYSRGHAGIRVSGSASPRPR